MSSALGITVFLAACGGAGGAKPATTSDPARAECLRTSKNITACEKAVTTGVYVNVGSMTSKVATNADAIYTAKMVAATEQTFGKLAPTFQRVWPGGGLPTKQQLQRMKIAGFFVDGTLVSVTTSTSGGIAKVDCYLSMLVATYPEKSIFRFFNGRAVANSRSGLQAATEDCVEAVVEDVVGKTIIPAIKSKL